MTLDEMTFDKMILDDLTADKMTLDKQISDYLTCCHSSLFKLEQISSLFARWLPGSQICYETFI
jgi:hypothetical protein